MLNLENNVLEVLPKAVGRLRSLTQARLSNNQLRWLPDEIGECVALQMLWVSNNHLIALPKTLGNLVQLKQLAVARNPLRSLPYDLHKCGNLKEVDIEGLEDVLSVPPAEIFKQGIPAVFLYLKEYERRLRSSAESNTLDLSNLGIKSSTLPVEVTNMLALTELNLSQNDFKQLSSSIAYMAALTSLDISQCGKLRELPAELGVMKQLSYINCQGAPLSSPPAQVVQAGAAGIVEYLSTINDARASHALQLNEMDLVAIDLAICQLPGLTLISMAGNKIDVVTPEISRLVALESLELQNNEIRHLPRQMEKCTSLTLLNLADNNLEGPVFADLWVGAWFNLRFINIRNNDKLSALPLGVASWTRLEQLELDATHFRQPPIEVLLKGARATVHYSSKFADTEGSVARLELSGYKFKDYPMEINQLKGLKSLLLQYNEIRTLPDAITQLADLREVHLSYNPLVTVPPILAHFTALRTLRLDNTLLEDLPGFMGRLVKLKSFSCVQNRLVTLPPEFGAMTALTKINLDSNGLRALPESLGRLTALRDLSLTRNRLSFVPPDLGRLHLVEELRLSFNRLRALPREIGFMTSLMRLRLGNNMIEEIPAELEHLTLLEDLSFNANHISVIPIVVGNLARLKNINYDNNPIKSPREDVLSAGGQALCLYFQKLYQSALTKGLDMSHAGLRHFPTETLTVPKLASLNLDDNALQAPPPLLPAVLTGHVSSLPPY